MVRSRDGVRVVDSEDDRGQVVAKPRKRNALSLFSASNAVLPPDLPVGSFFKISVQSHHQKYFA
jgi:hypothetical protein